MELDFIISVLRALLEWKYLAVGLAMFLDGTVLPVPGETILIFAGYLMYLGQMDPLLVIAVLAAMLWYEISRKFGETALIRFGKYVLINKEHIKYARKWFEKHGHKAVLIGRCIPMVSQFISIPAGIAKMDRGKFILYTAAGSFLWYAVLTYFFYWVGSKWDVALKYVQPLQLIGSILLGCVVVAFLIKKIEAKYFADPSTKKVP
jgi:membrane protein DedA with SNARE-associated domain